MKLFLLNAPRYIPYYIALLKENNEKGLLIVACDFDLLDTHCAVLANLPNTPFLEIIILSERCLKAEKNIYNTFKYRQSALIQIKNLFTNYPINEVIVSNDGPLFNQYALYLNRGSKNTYLEDGMFNYLYSDKKHSWYSNHVKSPLNNWLYKKIYFKKWLPNLGVGNNAYTHEVHLTYPNHIAHKLNKPICQLSIHYFLHQGQFIINLLGQG